MTEITVHSLQLRHVKVKGFILPGGSNIGAGKDIIFYCLFSGHCGRLAPPELRKPFPFSHSASLASNLGENPGCISVGGVEDDGLQ